MSCDEVRQGLPLLPGTDGEHAARVRAHALSCEACGELLRAFESDDRALAATARADRRAPAGVLDGFTAQVMARIEEEQRQRRLTPAPAPAPSPAGLVLRPFLRSVAAAAAVLVAVGVGLSARPAPRVDPVEPVRELATSPAPSPREEVLAPLPVAAVGEPLPAPRLERDPAPMPLRRKGAAVVPVDQGGGRRPARRARGPQQGELFDYLEKVLPNLHQRMMKELGEDKGREVRF